MRVHTMNKKTILIVDDSEFDRNLVKLALTRNGGFNILEATSGEHCLEMLVSNPIDLILMDIMMPGILGSQVLAHIRQIYSPIELPIIMISSVSDVSDIVNALKIGANDYITKPLNFDVTISRILTQLKLVELSLEMSKLKQVAAMDLLSNVPKDDIFSIIDDSIRLLGKSDSELLQNKEKIKNNLMNIKLIAKSIKSTS